ncbi:nitroreductase family protein [Peptoniphilus sp. KCTC 25270]|uniref:nitroreductase family protein n=1 Tax=Peptoniphilus sp. KCTC 25270 TaxID=2897414 RepID=UPI001E46404C|nr:nitroreductase family protein [Peptoniphilus sp. KCTC 25270]MCD1147624.1 nitroreductase family protein [Peptoniphilus sp. KCTC 25270]
MDLKERIIERRATRKYTDEKMDLETLKELLMYASMGPSKANAHPVEFLLIEDPEKKKALAELKRFGTKFLGEAPQIIAVLGDMAIDTTWVEEASIAAAYLGLLLEEEGFSSTWINIREQTNAEGKDSEEILREIFNIPDNYGVLALIPFGKKDERTKKRKPFEIDEKLHIDEF